MGRILPNLFAVVLIVVVFGTGGWVMWRGLKPEPSPDTRAIILSPSAEDVLLKRPVMPVKLEPAHPNNWSHFETGNGFTFYAPFATAHERLRGEDSAVGRISGPRFRLEYDFGFYSNTLEGMRNALDYSEAHIRIDGRAAVIRRARARDPQSGWRYLIGLYVPNAEWRWENNLDGTWAALAIEGSAASEEDCRIVEVLFSTIAFDKPLPRGAPQ